MRNNKRQQVRFCMALLWAMIGIVGLSPSTADQDDSATNQNLEVSQDAAEIDDQNKPEKRGWFDFMPGESAKNSLYLGMWSYHVLSGNKDYRTNNDLVGFTFRGYFLGTFMNSHDDRSWAGGVQRDLYRNRLREFGIDAGYRTGIIYGYESYQIGNTRLFPLLQMYADISYKRLGVQFTWAAEALTAGFLYRF